MTLFCSQCLREAVRSGPGHHEAQPASYLFNGNGLCNDHAASAALAEVNRQRAAEEGRWRT